MADPITGGDDLEDDLDLQPDFMAASDVDSDNEGNEIMSNGDEEDLPNPMEGGDATGFLSDDDEEPSEAVGQKRKAKEERPNNNASSSAGPSTALSDADKKKKRKLKEKERKEKVGQSKGS